MAMGIRDCASSFGLLILRLGFGGYMLTHGWGKLQWVLAGEWDKVGDPVGVGPQLSLILAMVAEFVCPILIMVGFLTRLAAIPTAIAMGVAAFVFHGADPWTMEEAAQLFMSGQTQFPVAKETALLYMIPFLTLVFTGAGKFSIDGLLWCRSCETPTQPSTQVR
jgi:putative oxidoreductase